MNNFYFIAVNYATSNLIETWAKSIYKFIQGANLIVIDNFSSNIEVENVKLLKEKLRLEVIYSENVGYGSALNKGISMVLSLNENAILFCSNLDIVYLSLPTKLPQGKFVYVPKVREDKGIDRNPFLTIFQKKLIPLYGFAAERKSMSLYILALVLNKIAGYRISPIWAIHGSLFCFNASIVSNIENLPFNDKSFLYAEEYEFASFVENEHGKFIYSSIEIFHKRNASTFSFLQFGTKHYIKKYWSRSFLNYISRQKLT